MTDSTVKQAYVWHTLFFVNILKYGIFFHFAFSVFILHCLDWISSSALRNPGEYSVVIMTLLIKKLFEFFLTQSGQNLEPSTLTTYESATTQFICKLVDQTVVCKWVNVRIAHF